MLLQPVTCKSPLLQMVRPQKRSTSAEMSSFLSICMFRSSSGVRVDEASETGCPPSADAHGICWMDARRRSLSPLQRKIKARQFKYFRKD